jgi:hypothetical protein
MDIPASLVAAFPPSPDLLLDCARRDIDAGILMDIAMADYGYKANEALAELRPICDQGIIPAPMGFLASEALTLTRWCDPENPESPPFAPGPTGRRGHQARLFACAVLLRAVAQPANANVDNVEEATLAQCLASAKVLGEEFSEAIARFLTWRLPNLPIGYDRVYFAVGLLVLAIRLSSGRFGEPELAAAAEFVLSEEAAFRREFPTDPTNPIPAAFGLESGYWQPLATELTNAAARIVSVEVRMNLLLCEMLLC